MKHLTPLELGRLLDIELEGGDRERAERHLGECAACRDALAALETQDSALKSALAHDPGAEYFESFAARVETRIRTAPRPSGAPERDRGLFGWLVSPHGIVWAGAAAAVVVGAGIVFITARDSGTRDLRRPALMRGGDRIAAPAAPEGPSHAAAPQAAGEVSRIEPPSRLDDTRDQGAASFRGDDPAGEKKAHAAKEEAGAGAGQPSAPGESAPSNAIRVRRLPSGEDVPERNEARSRFANPPTVAAPESAPEDRRLAKPGAQPLAPTPTPTPAPTLPKTKTTTTTTTTTLPVGQLRESKDALKVRGGRADEPRPTLEAEADRVTANLCGTVRDRSGRPIAGAQVTLADLGRTTTTDPSGHFCLASPAGSRTLSVLALGFEPQRRTVQVGSDPVESDLTLEPVAVIEGPAFSWNARGLLLDRAASDLSTWPPAARGPARQAQAKMDRAAQIKSADRFDEAADDWNRVLERVRGHQAETEVRARLAESRYHAWQITPTSGRRVAAIEALTSYLVRAPVGGARDSAAKRLDRVKQ